MTIPDLRANWDWGKLRRCFYAVAATVATGAAGPCLSAQRFSALQAKIEAHEQALEWLGMTLAIVGVGFGALITLTVIFFALRTEENAAAAARREIQSSKDTIDRHVAEAEASVRRAEAVAEQIEQQRLRVAERSEEVETSWMKVQEIVARIDASSTSSLSRQEVQILQAAASAIKDKPRDTLSSDEIHVLLAEAREKRNWARMLELAGHLQSLGRSQADSAAALIYQSIALHYQGDSAGSSAKAREVIDKYSESTEPSVLERVVQAHFNMGKDAQDSGLWDTAIAQFNKAEEIYTESMSVLARVAVAKAITNRGVIYFEQKNLDAALREFERALRILGEPTDKQSHEPFFMALDNKGMMLELLGRRGEALVACDQLLAEAHRTADPELLNCVTDVTNRRNRLLAQKR